ncbi:cupredoxin domain-containing protein [Candidatus Woesearchaeota archaeon]|nr:cupredoxin domain-containing protein [Candidatus Woesearchaeota archaeon]
MKKLLFISLLLTLFLVGCSVQEQSSEVKEVELENDEGSQIENQFRTIKIDAERFMYNPDEIVIKKGETVKLEIVNADTDHGIRIPELGIKGTEELIFSINETGEYEWKCAVYCGEGHQTMGGKIIVEE